MDRRLPALIAHESERYVFHLEGAVSHRLEDLDAMMEVAHERWEAACVAEDVVLGAGPGDDADDEVRFAHMRALILVAHHRETVWGEYTRISALRQRTTTTC